MTTTKHALTGVAAAFAAALFLASCGPDPDGEPTPAPEQSGQESAEFNDADVQFAQMMIPHHEQAVEMADLAESRAGDEVAALAEEIRAAQGPEIEQLNGMLDEWGRDADDSGDHEGMDGMITQEQMAELEQSEGEEFDELFLELMVEHHEGAVAMAGTELQEGTDPEARELAQEIIDAQEAEIQRMNELLGVDGEDQGQESPSEDREHDGH